MSREYVYFRKKDLWLKECLDKIIKSKKAMGIRTNMSYEIVRLAKNGLMKELIGADLDKKILVDDTPKKSA
jgi:hypothetical protein